MQATQVLSNQGPGASNNIVTEVTKVLATVDRSRLSYVAKRLKRLRASDARPRAITSRRLRPRRPGWVPDAVREVLAGAGPMRLKDIHAAMERQLGQPVSIESVSWCLLPYQELTLDRGGLCLAYEQLEQRGSIDVKDGRGWRGRFSGCHARRRAARHAPREEPVSRRQ